jgi:uncharacterized membrane protein
VALLGLPHVLFIVLALPATVAFAILTPPLWGLDEPSHFARSYQIARGDILPGADSKDPANFMPDNLFELSSYRTSDILDAYMRGSVLHRKDVTDNSIYKMLTERHFFQSKHYLAFIATYSPVAYPGPIIGIIIAHVLDSTVGQTLFLARFMSLVFYIALAGVSIWLVRKTKNIKWLLFAFALIPTSIFQASVVSADSIATGLLLILVSLIYRIYTSKNKEESRKFLYALALTCVLLPLVKINYVFFTFAVLILPVRHIGTKRFTIIYKAAVSLLGLVATLGWASLTKVADAPELSQRSDQLTVMPSDQIAFTLHHPIDFVLAIFRSLVMYGDEYYRGIFLTASGNSIDMPWILVLLITISLFLVAIIAKTELQKIIRPIIYLNILGLFVAVTVFAGLYAGFTPVGWWFVDGVQGRYFTPILFPLIALAGILLPIKINIERRWLIGSLVTVLVLGLGVSIIYNILALY